jgi:hypothetical protein
VQTDAYPHAFNGRISCVAPALDPNTRTLQARFFVNPVLYEMIARDGDVLQV